VLLSISSNLLYVGLRATVTSESSLLAMGLRRGQALPKVPPPSPSSIADTKDLVIVCQLSFTGQAGFVMNPTPVPRCELRANQTKPIWLIFWIFTFLGRYLAVSE